MRPILLEATESPKGSLMGCIHSAGRGRSRCNLRSLLYSPSQLAALGMTPAQLRVHSRRAGGAWQLETDVTVDEARQVVVVRVAHLTDFRLAGPAGRKLYLLSTTHRPSPATSHLLSRATSANRLSGYTATGCPTISNNPMSEYESA